MTEKQPTRVLFVCLGNICRSPTAEGVFQHLVQERGLSEVIEVDSCGTSDWHIGSEPDQRAAEAAARRGYDLGRLRGRQVQVDDFASFDYILAMDSENLKDLEEICPASYRGHLGLFLEFAKGAPRDVPDPYYGGDSGFDDVLDLIESASFGLMRALDRELLRG